MSKWVAGTAPAELDIPDGVAGADRATEVLRAFVADGNLHVALQSDAFEANVEEWGRLLGRIAHHVARAASLQGYATEHEALGMLRRGYEATLPAAQPTLTGAVRGRPTH
jgi:hypothetical protein